MLRVARGASLIPLHMMRNAAVAVSSRVLGLDTTQQLDAVAGQLVEIGSAAVRPEYGSAAITMDHRLHLP